MIANKLTTTQRIKPCYALIGLSFSLGCAHIPSYESVTTAGLIGSWYGQQTLENEQLMWVSNRNADNTFEITFKKCSHTKEIFHQVKTGTWSHKNATYTTTTVQLSDHNQTWQPATPNRQYIEKYAVHKLQNNVLYYSNTKQNNQPSNLKISFKAYRVDTDFKLQCGKPPDGLPLTSNTA